MQLISTRNFITVNKDLIKLLGLEEAILLGELASEHDYWESQDKLEDGYFYSTVENIQEHTTLSDHKQRKALKNLKDKGLIEIKVKGIPAKRYIKINEEQVFKLFNNQFLKNLRTSNEKIKELDTENFKTNNNIINNNIINNNIDNNIKENIVENIPYNEIIEFLNQSAGTNYRASSKKTKDLIKARYNEGYTIEDFKIVIVNKCYDWLSNNDMQKYLRPETLFGTKFEGYLGQKRKELTTKDIEKFMDFSNFSNTEVSNRNELPSLF